MGHGGPYSKRLRSWPHRHAGGDRSGRSRGGFPRTSISSGGGQGPNTAHLLERRARKEANRAASVAKSQQELRLATDARQVALKSWIASAGLTQAERNQLCNLGIFPRGRLVVDAIYEEERVRVPEGLYGYKWVTHRKKVGTAVTLPGNLARHYPAGLIPQADIAAMQQLGVL